jgi:hypothetical protein
MLNIINAIIFIPSKEEEIEKIRDELNKISSIQRKDIKQEQSQNQVEQNEVNINSQDDDLQ